MTIADVAQRAECVRALRLAMILGAAAVLTTPVGSAASDDTDACKLASAVVVGALITPQDNVDVRTQSAHPAPGESTCVWSAVRRGLTDDAPPEGRLSLAFYHMASPQKAFRQVERLTKVTQPPSLVRTRESEHRDSGDSRDILLRPDADTVAARHGSDIVVVDASQTRSLARERAGWAYRLEAMAFAAAGAHVLGPVDARATAPLCKLVSPDHVLALLTLSPSTLDAAGSPSDDGLRCHFRVKDASRKFNGWTTNHGNAQVRREDLGTNAAALERLHADRPFNRPSTLVTTTDQTDRVVPTPDHPEEVEAVHGPYLVTLNLGDVTAAAHAHPTWAYRVQRTALEAAGATIVAAAGMVPDPVTPGPAPPPAAFAWRTSGHVAPSWSALSDPVLHAVAFLARHRFVMMPLLIGGSILFAVLRNRRNGLRPSRRAIIGYEPDPPPRKAKGWILAPLCIVLAVVNVMFGTEISGALVYHFGAEGRATVTGSRGTATVYNNRNVLAHDVLIKTADGRVVESGFEDDDFNVYPSHNATRYPGKGDEFNVRYLTRFPQDFVILGEDDSPWAHAKRCGDLGRTRSEAEAKLAFAPDVQSYRDAADAAIRAEVKAECAR